MIGPFAMSLALLGLSGLLIDQHRRAWARAQADGALNRAGAKFARGQYLRRMVGSSLIGVVGALIGVQPIVPREPLWVAMYMAALAIGCSAIFLAGVVDAIAGARFYHRVRLEDRLQQAALAFEMQQRSKESPPDDA